MRKGLEVYESTEFLVQFGWTICARREINAMEKEHKPENSLPVVYTIVIGLNLI